MRWTECCMERTDKRTMGVPFIERSSRARGVSDENIAGALGLTGRDPRRCCGFADIRLTLRVDLGGSEGYQRGAGQQQG